jgi:hypothetical protein
MEGLGIGKRESGGSGAGCLRRWVSRRIAAMKLPLPGYDRPNPAFRARSA